MLAERFPMKRCVLLALTALQLLAPAAAQPPSPALQGFSVGFDLFGLTYNQFAVYLEVPLAPTLSMTTALAYSPAGGWQPDFEYWYLQTELRSYLHPTSRKEFYSGFGLALYLSPNLMDFSRWNPSPSGTSSSVFGAYGLLGYKYFPDGSSGFYVDPNLMLYALAPLNVRFPDATEKGAFFYKPAAPMANLVAGWEF